MKAVELKRFLDAQGLTVVDVAAATKISPNTIYRFLRGLSIHRGTLFLLESYVKQTQLARVSGAKTATG